MQGWIKDVFSQDGMPPNMTTPSVGGWQSTFRSTLTSQGQSVNVSRLKSPMKSPLKCHEVPHFSHGLLPKIWGNSGAEKVKFLADTLDFSLFTLDIHGGITDVPRTAGPLWEKPSGAINHLPLWGWFIAICSCHLWC